MDFLDINLFRLHRQVLDRNGFEAWRQLCQLFEPRTKSRSISLLQALMSFPNFDKSRTLLEQIQSLERIREEFQETSGTSLSDDIMTSTLLRVLPKHIQQHLHLQMTSTSDYRSVRQMVLSYEVASSTYSTGRIHAELDVVTSYATPSGGPQPMEIDQIAQYGKSSGKYGVPQGKGKDSKGNFSKGKNSKGKHSKGKYQPQPGKTGKGKGKDKGPQDGKGKKLHNNQCSYCLKFGHWRKDCNKLQEDQKHNRVRQIEEFDGEPASGSNQVPGSGTSASNVRLVSFAPDVHEYPVELDSTIEDLTVHWDSSHSANHSIRVLTMEMLKPKIPAISREEANIYDLTYSDGDIDWTLCSSPSRSIHSSEDERPQLRAVSDSSNVEIILDSKVLQWHWSSGGAARSPVHRCSGITIESFNSCCKSDFWRCASL